MLELNYQVFKLCLRRCNSDGLAMLFECKICKSAQKTILQRTPMGQAINHMVVRRSNTRPLSSSLSRTLDLTVQHWRHWHRIAQNHVHIRKGAVLFKQSRIETAQSTRRMHKFGVSTPNIHTNYLCPICGRAFQARIGLVRHTEISLYNSDVILVLLEDKGQQSN